MKTEAVFMDFTALIGLLGTLVGAFLGAWVARRLSHPKPVILIDRIEINSSEGRPDEMITPDKSLINLCNENPFLSSISFKRTEEREYINSLRKALLQIEEARTYTLQALKRVSLSLRENLSVGDYESIEKIWFQDQYTIWDVILYSCRRDGFNYQDSTLEDKRAGHCRNVKPHEDDESGSFIVVLPGYVADLQFSYSKKALNKEEQKTFAERTAQAFACGHEKDLQELVHFMSKIALNYESKLNELHQLVEIALEKYNRLIIRGQISNIGGSPFSVLSRGRVFILAKGYPYKDVDIHEHNISSNLSRDIAIDLQLMSNGSPSNGLLDASISVQPGGIYRFIAVSEQYVSDMGIEGVVLPKLFEAGERKFYIGLSVILPGNQPVKTYYTSPQIFRDLMGATKIKSKSENWFSRFLFWHDKRMF